MSNLCTSPEDGIPPLADTPEAFRSAARALNSGHGPFAIDTERASGYRYDDRAFLLQIRRKGAGTFLIDPEGGREELTQALSPVLNGAEWIIHAAPSDLPCLAWLGLYPGTIFDTELASRMLGYSHPNLSSMTETLLGVELEKSFGNADWSIRPIPQNQLIYAALDVEFLIELREILTDILAETDKLDWAFEEFAEIVNQHKDISSPTQTTWRALRGIGRLSKPQQLNAAAALWKERNKLAQEKDVAPGRILPNRTLIDVALSNPSSEAELRRIKGFPRRRKDATRHWFSILEKARLADKNTWPSPVHGKWSVPNKNAWSRDYPEAWALYQDIRDELDLIAEDLNMQPETIYRTADIRHIVWATRGTKKSKNQANVAGQITNPDQIYPALKNLGVRSWQAELLSPTLARKLFPNHS